MTSRFDHTKVVYGDGRTRGVTATCRDCGQRGHIPFNSMKGPPDDNRDNRIIARKFQAIGWIVGADKNHDRCPECERKRVCAAAERQTRNLIPKEMVMSVPPKSTASLSVVEPRAPSRDDKKIINAKLHEVYAGETVGYSSGWTDFKVADDLGVPRAWVKEIREEFFGPESSNEDMRRTLAEAKITLSEIKQAETQIRTLLQPPLARADKIEKTVIAIEGALR